MGHKDIDCLPIQNVVALNGGCLLFFLLEINAPALSILMPSEMVSFF